MKNWRKSVQHTVAAAAMTIMGCSFCAAEDAGAAQASAGPKVKIDAGKVRGFKEDGVVRFYGIPYAAPPIGDLRWRAPVEPEPWKEVRDATKFGPICLQATTLGPFAGPQNDNEDCLYLNVYTPDLNPPGKSGLPVIVWLHGGGNVDGNGVDYDGSKLAREGKTVVVTINYRLGLLGFLAHPALDAEGHPFGNYGILDQQAALRWVQTNIAKFGGDKNTVTLGGQSAGSIDTESNMISPLAEGLFHRAILQSVVMEPEPLDSAEAKGTSFAVEAGCGSGTDAATAKCLRKLSAKRIFKLSGTASVQAPYTSLLIQDGQIVPSRFADALAAGDYSHMPVMSGTTHDELTFSRGIAQYFSGKPASRGDYKTVVESYGAASYPEGTLAQVKRFYPLTAFPTPQLALNSLETDPLVCAQRYHNQLLSKETPVYAYEFADRTAPSYFPKMQGFEPLAYHTGDIQYLFPGWHGGPDGVKHKLNKEQEQLSDELVQAWTNFARTGNPNGQGKSPWPRYKDKDRVPGILSQNIPFSVAISDAEFRTEHKCGFWDTLGTYKPRETVTAN